MNNNKATKAAPKLCCETKNVKEFIKEGSHKKAQ